jgi:hypothetical protein
LVSDTNDQGLGNIMGQWLSKAAIGRSIGAAVYTSFRETQEGNTDGAWLHGGYDYDVFRQVISFPCHLRFVGSTQGMLDANVGDPFKIHYETQDSREYDVRWVAVNDYLPETMWHLWQGQCKRGGSEFPARLCRAIEPPPSSPSSPPLVTRETFLANYRLAQQSLSSKVDLCNPPAKSYLAVHVRRLDRGTSLNLTDLKKSVRRVQVGVRLRLAVLICLQQPLLV